LIIWSGLGFLVVVFFIGSFVFSQLVFNAFFGIGFYETHMWVKGIAFLLSALLCWFVGNYLKKRKVQKAIDSKTGKEIEIDHSNNRLFFIQMNIWGLIFALFGIIELIYSLVKLL
jgi:hypothetical protein